MSKLIFDILVLIIEDLDNDYNSLFNCLLVNKFWCKTTVPILWKDFLNYVHINYKFYSLLKIFFYYLPENSPSLRLFHENKVNLSFVSTQKPLFNYISFIKSIIIFDMSQVIKVCFNSNFTEIQKEIIDKEFNNIIFSQCSRIKYLDLSNEFYERKYDVVNFIQSKDHLSNLVEFTCAQCVDEKIFYILAEICVNIKRLEIRRKNKNNHGLFRLIEAQNQLEYFCYKGRKSRLYDWNSFCKGMDSALIKHASSLKHFDAPIRLCIPSTRLNSFINLETLMLGYSTNDMNDLHLVTLPKLQYLKVCYLTNVKELIQNTSGHLKKIEIYKPRVTADDIIPIISIIHQHCPLLEYFCFPYVVEVNNSLGELLRNCKQLKKIFINGFYLNGDTLLKILLKSISLQHIEINGDWKFSIERLKEFLNNWKERRSSLYFKLDLNVECSKEALSNVFYKFIDDGVLKSDSCIANSK
ncbi:hypothetical protein C1645_840600 [Glomus cerebriforme]|uniref:F-box domain-containing protein n=1 Tax=Glomus cerebriforme TaxID=658196 RepID=A0A397S555_9GLOM|nr:hypothetical protein C1645_840600 [Glomus cerebriforme]